MFGIARCRARLALATLAGSLACGPADLDPAGIPRGWLDTDRAWWVMATVVAPPDAPPEDASLAGVATPLHTARFVLDADSLVLLTDDGATLARLPARPASDHDAVAVDWGASDVIVELEPGWLARPRPAPTRPFLESAAFHAHRVGPDYIEWTVPAAVDPGADGAELLGRRDFDTHLRFSAVPARAPAPAFVDDVGRFRYRTAGVVPRLDLFDDPDVPWSEQIGRAHV